MIMMNVIACIVHEDNNGYSPAAENHIEYPPYDGWYNNFAHPEWGAAGTPCHNDVDCLITQKNTRIANKL